MMLCARNVRMLAVVAVVVAMGVQELRGQDAVDRAVAKNSTAQSVPKTTALSVRQARIKQMMLKLEHKLEALAASLAKTEPEQARRLGNALRESKKMLLTERMDLISTLLSDTQFKNANKHQKTLLSALTKLVELLAKQDEKEDGGIPGITIPEITRQIRILDGIIGDEERNLREAKIVANPTRAIVDIDAMIVRLKLLIKREKDVLASTHTQRVKGVDMLPKIADQQHRVLNDTKRLALDLGGGKSQANATGQQSLFAATKHQQHAEDNLANGKGKAAEGDAKRAIADMEAALAQLEKERGRIAKFPPDAIKQVAEFEEAGADNAGELAKAMGKNGAKPGGVGKKQPGQAKVEQGQKSQSNAAGKLGKNNPGGAADDQHDAIRNFKAAKRELEEHLAQLREAMQLEFLAALESRFRDMLERQRPLTHATAALNKANPNRKKRPRAESLRVREFVQEERALAENAQATLDIVLEDGTSVIFPKIVSQLRDDLRGVAALLEGGHTGSYTQSQQVEIERTLEELINAVTDARMKTGSNSGKPGTPGKPNGPPEPPPLLPDSAELKLLKSVQLRVNRRTEQFDVVRPDIDSLDGVLRKEIRNIAKRQQNVATIAEEIVENY